MMARAPHLLRCVAVLSTAIIFTLLSSAEVQGFSLPKVTTQRKVCSKAIMNASVGLNTETPALSSDAIVVGGGPAGLLSAIMLAQKFPDNKIMVYDRLSPPPSPTDESVWSDVAKFYLIGLGSRGQKALAAFNVWEEVKNCCISVLGRKDWAPESKADEGVERIFTDRPVTTQVLPRDKLVGVLHRHIVENYSDKIDLNYGYQVTPEDFGSQEENSVVVRVSKCDDGIERDNPTSLTRPNQKEVDELCDVENSFTVSTSLLIAADGTARTIASQMEKNDKSVWEAKNAIQKLFGEKPFKIKRYIDDNQRVYKTIPMKLPKDWRPDLNYSARTKDGRVNFDALPADANGNYCGVLLLKKDDEFAAPNTDPNELRKQFDDVLPQFSQLIDDETMQTIAQKPPSYLPRFRYVGPRLHQNDRTVILGDCAHTVKPYFGLGANSALEDVQILGEAIDSTSSIQEAVHLFSKERANEAKDLVQISRELDRPGKLGFVTFILPLILDATFHGIAPKIFAPNVISMLQREGMTFRGVRRRKRMDRIAQIATLGAVFWGMSKGTRSLVNFLVRFTNKGSTTIVGSIAATVGAAFFLRKVSFFLNPNVAPADVMAKTREKITDNDSFLTGVGGKGNKDEVQLQTK